MKAVKWWVAVAFAVVGLGACGQDKQENKLPDAVFKALQSAEEYELYSLDGGRGVKDGWHGAKVLGKTTVKGADRKTVAAALKKGVAEGDAAAACFNPRHGIRVTHDKKTYDLVICFECLQVKVYTDGSDKPQSFLTSRTPEKALNKILTDAKVPLDKPEK